MSRGTGTNTMQRARLRSNPTPGELFHGSRFRFEPGKILTAGEIRANQGIGRGDGYMYAAESVEVAAVFAEAGYGPDGDIDASPRIYRVEPVDADTLERDPNELDSAGCWRATQLRVLGEL